MMEIMRSLSKLVRWTILGLCLAPGIDLAGPAGVARAASAAASKPAAEEAGGFAVYAGPAPFGSPGRVVFLMGDEWTPQVFTDPPEGLDLGAQGRLTWRVLRGSAPRQAVHFDATEVPLQRDNLLPEERGAPEPAVWKNRSRLGAVLLLHAMAPRRPEVLELAQRWHKAHELTGNEWAYTLRLLDQKKALIALARSDGAAAYGQLAQLFAAGRWAEARGWLKKKGKLIEPVAAARHDQGEPDCAPVAAARGGVAPTGLSWVRLLGAAVAHAQGKRPEARKLLGQVKARTPRLRESIVPRAGAADPPDELFLPERPRALLARAPGFLALLTE